MYRPEILSPAGSFESLVAAVKGGCDAIYLGGNEFSARSYAGNFDEENLREGIKYAHLHDVRIYYALNTMIKEKELKTAYQALKTAYLLGIDAVIVQDLGIATMVKDYFPDLELHGSTQMTVHSLSGVLFMEDFGFKRIVLSRELSIKEIDYIKRNSTIELEVFVHGALCYAYSGKCLMSSYIGGRSGNRGKCAQTCRLPYEVGKGQAHSNTAYFLSPKDIMSLNLIPQLIEIGIASFKIEGRMKNPTYVGKVTALYQKYTNMAANNKIDYLVEDQDLEDLLTLFNRGGFSEGYLNPSNESMISLSKPNHQGVLVGKVMGVSHSKNRYQVELMRSIDKGDTLVINSLKEHSFIIDHPLPMGNQTLSIHMDHLSVGTEIYRIVSQSLGASIESVILAKNIKPQVAGFLKAKIGQPLSLTITYRRLQMTVTSEIVETAIKQPVDQNWLKEQLEKTGNLELDFASIMVDMDEGIFVTVKAIKSLRRDVISGLVKQLVNWYPHRDDSLLDPFFENVTKKTNQPINHHQTLTVLLRNSSQFDIVKGYPINQLFIDMMFISNAELGPLLEQLSCEFQGKVYVRLPIILRERYLVLAKETIKISLEKSIDGFVVGSYDAYELVKNSHKEIIIDDSLLIYNNLAIKTWKNKGIKQYHLGKELTLRELKDLDTSSGIINLYGYQSVMITAQCGYKEHFGCDQQSGFYQLNDRKENEILVYKNCNYCVNTIFNAHKTYLLDKQESLKEIGYGHFRLDLTNETSEEINRIMKAYTHKLSPEEIGLTTFTRGHIQKGVE